MPTHGAANADWEMHTAQHAMLLRHGMLHLADLNLTFGMAEHGGLERILEWTGRVVRGHTEVGIGREGKLQNFYSN